MPALVVGHVVHDRARPLRHRFRNRHHAWLVEVPAGRREPQTVPGRLGAVLGRALRLRAADHLDAGRLGGGLRGDLERWLHRRGVELAPEDQVLLLAQPRVAGYAFNPLSVWWVLRDPAPPHNPLQHPQPPQSTELPRSKCRDHSTYCVVGGSAGEGDEDGEGGGRQVVAVVAEVHNTYGERHAYLLRPDAQGRSSQDKEFYVSPFNDVEGRYEIRTSLTPERVTVSIALHTGDPAPTYGDPAPTYDDPAATSGDPAPTSGDPVGTPEDLDRDPAGGAIRSAPSTEPLFTATVTGRPHAVTPRRVLATLVRQPGGSYRTSALIRAHGVWLWLRRLPVRPRPHHPEDSVR
nr:DUF1365 domain-containing protein [Janibacter alkaliphilus]